MGRKFKSSRQILYALSDRLNDSLEIPAVTAPGSAQIILSDNREVVVDGCKGILQYDDACVRLNTGRMVVCVTGSTLSIGAMQGNQIRITGTILQIDFA